MKIKYEIGEKPKEVSTSLASVDKLKGATCYKKSRNSIEIDKFGNLVNISSDELKIKNGDNISVVGMSMYVKNGLVPKNAIFKIGDGFTKWVDYVTAFTGFIETCIELLNFRSSYKIGDPIECIDKGSTNFDYQSSDIYFVLYL